MIGPETDSSQREEVLDSGSTPYPHCQSDDQKESLRMRLRQVKDTKEANYRESLDQDKQFSKRKCDEEGEGTTLYQSRRPGPTGFRAH